MTAPTAPEVDQAPAPITGAQLEHLEQIEHIANEDHWGFTHVLTVCHACNAAPVDDPETHVRTRQEAAA